MVVVVAVVMCVGGGPAQATISVDQTSRYCSQVHSSLTCVFTNTSEDVEVREVGRDVLRLMVEGAPALRGSQPCGTTLHVLTSSNVTLERAISDTVEDRVRQKRKSSEREIGNTEFPVRIKPLQSISVHSTISASKASSGADKTHVSYSVSTGERATMCERNVSVVQSKLHWLRGQFHLMDIQLSEVSELDGDIGELDLRSRSKVSNFSASGNQVSIKETEIQLLSRLEVRQQLNLHNVDIGSVVPPGLLLHQPQDVGTPVYNGHARAHTLSDVKVNTIESGTLQVMGGQVFITNMSVDEARTASLVVRDGGVLTLINVHVRRGPKTCLVLHDEAAVVLVNFTLGSDTISHMNISNTDYREALYPLRNPWPVQGKIRLRIGPVKSASEVTDNPSNGFPGFPWYWIMIMAVVGIFAGMIVGSAIMWRRPGLLKGQPSALTLSDLIGRDRLQEETESQTSNTLPRPDFQRQDSGLTSSSFASYTPCQERPQTTSPLFPIQAHNPECQKPSPDPEPNVFVHVPPLACTRGEVIYEEVEALSALKVEEPPYDLVK